VLVTGATGFLGRELVRRLVAAGIEVTAHGKTRRFPDETIESVTGDLADADTAAELLAAWRWNAMVSLAGPVTSGNEDLRTGIAVVTEHERIALHVRRYAQDARIVQASSMTVYGLPETIDVDEGHPTRPQHLYGLAKLVAEDILLAEPHVDAWVLRLPGLFSGERTTGALYHFCKAARAGEPLRVTVPTPTPWNILHVADAADAILRALQAPGTAREPINISYGEPVDLVSVARLLATHARTGSVVEATIEHPPLHLVTTRAARLLGWQPPSLRERLLELYEDYAAA
jgi:UDP-glucose 4-epimerase